MINHENLVFERKYFFSISILSIILLYFFNGGYSREFEHVISLLYLAFLMFIHNTVVYQQKNVISLIILFIMWFVYINFNTEVDFLNFTILYQILILFYIFECKFVINNYKNVHIFLYIISFLLSLQFLLNSFQNRYVLNAIDPNISAGIMLLFFYLSYRVRFKFGIFFSIIAIALLLSRNYFFSILIFYFVILFKAYGIKILKYLYLKSFLKLVFFFLAFSVAVSFWFLANVTEYTEAGNTNRLVTIEDSGNKQRFITNSMQVLYFIDNTKDLLFGINNYKDFQKEFSKVMVHNSYLMFISKYGLILFIVYTIFVSLNINRYMFYNNLEYIISYLFFCSFLHDFYIGIHFIIFITIIFLIPQVIRKRNVFYSTNVNIQ